MNQEWINWCWIELEVISALNKSMKVFLPFDVPHAAGQSYEADMTQKEEHTVFSYL